MQENYTIKKILHVALGDRKGPWPTFCCLCHSDVNSHFKKFNTSNTFLTLGEPHKLKHTLSTLSSKHDSMCHRKTCMGQKIITENPEVTWLGIPSFQRVSSDHCGFFSTLSPVSMKNTDIWNFYSSPTMNNGKLIQYFRSDPCAIVSNMANVLIPFFMREKMACFELCFSPVLMQN